jgi:hypothetical protein
MSENNLGCKVLHHTQIFGLDPRYTPAVRVKPL